VKKLKKLHAGQKKIHIRQPLQNSKNIATMQLLLDSLGKQHRLRTSMHNAAFSLAEMQHFPTLWSLLSRYKDDHSEKRYTAQDEKRAVVKMPVTPQW
jgi:ferric iron reductase protein FhuF